LSTRIGLLSDVHATPEPVREALALFAREGVTRILCPGDIAGYGEALEETVALLQQSGCEAICGNHDRWFLEREGEESAAHRYLRGLPGVRTYTIEGLSLYMVHASPPDSTMDGIKLLDENGAILPAERQAWAERLAGFEHDLLLVGHTHQVFAERLGRPLVINPGSTVFNHSCAILHLPEGRVDWHPLGGRALVRSWNWGMGQLRRVPEAP